MDLRGFLLLGGGVILWWIYMVTRERYRAGYRGHTTGDIALEASNDAVIVSLEHGQLVYVNDRARRLFGLNGDEPHLEVFARRVEPAESFLELFASQGQASFQIGDQWVEASSHRIPTGEETRTVVVLRELTPDSSTSNEAGIDLSLVMTIVNEIGETIDARQSVEQVLQSLLTIVLKHIVADAGEICLWDEDKQALYPHGWVGDAAYILALIESGGFYALGEGIPGWVAQHDKPLLVENTRERSAVQPKIKEGGYRSFVAVPLRSGDRFVGVLKLADTKPHHFSRTALAILQAIARPASTAIHNAELYAGQTQHIVDMANLQQVAEQYGGAEEISEVYLALNQRIAELVGADMCGILLYDEAREALVAQPPFFGLPYHVANSYIINLPEGSGQRDIWENQPYWISNDVVDEPLVEEMGLMPIVNVAGVRNTAIIPLQIGRQRIGIIQISNKQGAQGFTMDDIQNLRILATQAAIVVENIRLFQLEQRRTSELVGLQEMTHAIGALSHEDEFYSVITERIANLMNVQMVGVLLYDEARQRLVRRLPFYGVDDDLVEVYSIDVSPGTVMGELWEEEEYWYSNNVATEALVFEAGLYDMAMTAGVEKTLFALMRVGDRRLGVLQVSNKMTGEDFTPNDGRQLLVLATQAAVITENANLFREARARADEATSLRRVAEEASRVMTTRESFASVLEEVTRLLESPVAFINVLDEQRSSLITYPNQVYGIELHEPLVQDIYAEGFEDSVALSHRPFYSDDIMNDTRVIESYRRAAEQLKIQRALVVPLVLGEQSFGEIGVANRQDAPYDEDDERLLSAIASQVAAAMGRVRLFEATGENLDRRVEELNAISRVSNELTLTFDFDRVLSLISSEAVGASQADGSFITLLQQDGTNDDGEPIVERRLVGTESITGAQELSDIEHEAIKRRGDAVVVDDYENHPFVAFPPNARSAVAVAFLYGDDVIGVISLYHSEPFHFDSRAATFLVTLSTKAAVSYSNSLNYQQQIQRSERLRQRVDQLSRILELGQMVQSNVELDMILEAIAFSVQQSIGFDVIVMLLTDEDGRVMRRVAQAGLPLNIFLESKANLLPVDDVVKLLAAADDNRLGESYYFPVEVVEQWDDELRAALLVTFEDQRPIADDGPDAWRVGDLLLVPLMGGAGEHLGLMALSHPFNNRRPTPHVTEVLEIFAHQAATTIQNNRLYVESMRNVEEEARLSTVMETISSTLDVEQILQTVSKELARILPIHQVSLAVVDAETQSFNLFATSGDDNFESVQRGHTGHLEDRILGHVLETGEEYLLEADSPQKDEYEDVKIWHQAGEQVSYVLPLMAGGERPGAIHLGSREAAKTAFEQRTGLVRRIVHLASVAIQNARLFDEAINLRNYNQSIVESIQQGIVVLDRSARILTINDYMRSRFAWSDRAVGQDLFAYRPELADILADDMRIVLDKGVQRERIQVQTRRGNNAAVQNFYVYPRLSIDADVVRGAVLLIEDVTERTRLEHDIERRANQLAALTEISSRITASLDRDEVFELAMNEFGRIIEYDTMTFWRREGDRLYFVDARGLDTDTTSHFTRFNPNDHARFTQVIESQQVIVIDNLRGWDALPGETGMKSWMGVPLVNQGYVAGVIVLNKTEPGFYDEQAQQAAATFGNQVAVALSNANLFEETQRRTARLSLLNRVSNLLAQSLDRENILEIGLQEIAQTLNINSARALMFEQERAVARVVVEYPRGDAPPEEIIDLQSDVVYQEISQNSESLFFGDTNMVPDYRKRIELLERGVKACAVVPIVLGSRVLGIYELESLDSTREFSQEQIELANIIANQVAISVQNANLLEQTLVRTRELETLLEGTQKISLTRDLEVVFSDVVNLMLQSLDMDDCVVMMWDDVEGYLEVEVGVNRTGDTSRIIPAGTRLSLADYPARRHVLEEREVLVIERNTSDADATELADMEARGDYARMFVPLIVRDRSIGLVQLDLQQAIRTFSYRDSRLAQALGAQAAIAIENARLSTQTASQVEELFVINDLSQAISSTIEIDDMLRIVRDRVRHITQAEELYLALYDADDDMLTFPVAVRRDGEEFEIPPRKLGNDEVSFVIKRKQPLILGGDVMSLDEVRRSMNIESAEPEARSYLAVPLIASQAVVGAIAVRDTQYSRAFGLNDQRVLTTVGSQLGAAIQNARLFEQIRGWAVELNQRVEERTNELQQERDRLNTLYRITSELAQSLDMDRVLNRALDLVVSAAGADDGVILLLDPADSSRFHRIIERNHRRVNGDGGEVRPHPAEDLAQWLIEIDQSIVIDDLLRAEQWDADASSGRRWRSALGVLLETNDEAYGVIVLFGSKHSAFNQSHLLLVQAAANQVASAFNNAELYNLIRDQAESLGDLLRNEQEEAEKSNAILQSIADGVMVTDANNTIISFNQAAQQILGLSQNQVIRKTLDELVEMYGEQAAVWVDSIQRWGQSLREQPPDEVLVERLEIDNRITSVHMSSVYINEQFLGTVSVFRDITKEVEVDRIKSEFVSNVSHELRTPMTSIKGYADLLVAGMAGEVTPQQREFLVTIKNNAERLGDLVNDLLNISRIETGVLMPGPVDLETLITSTVNHLVSDKGYGSKNMTLTIDVDPSVRTITADDEKLSQIIKNLVDNAFNYTYPGGSITITAERRPEDNEQVLLAVKDSGIGIPPEFQDRVWDRFERNEADALVMDVPGTGLGLPIVKHLVEMHRGEIWFDTTPGEGTTFYVVLPIEQPEATKTVQHIN
ncbi:MAG: GAF domain-containing protein [Chloroflexi bacterium]|nr:MAG: GAF domain-containing protein [Chloroflexota bacterium]